MTDTIQANPLNNPDFVERSTALRQAALAYGNFLLEGGYDMSKVAECIESEIDIVVRLLRSLGGGVSRAGATPPPTLPSSARRETDSTRQREGGNVSFEERLKTVRPLLRTRGT